ncbi:alpha/beta hydrolase [Methylomonas sp. SURF-2]|uniref:Alpha/beta hydrolase n=1 Tax=Methylomonas subterranea TaxID=2952225 RepID=A0ABT1TAV5_9GAMM|nr:alpha/beta fold hydrolase [Methylomonas sp. SURF-2]MCQ8102578.1 alpha/beta hydrolase [Methylomonas sp. SURF-2]
MHRKYHLLAMLLLSVGVLSGCGLLAVQEQHEKIARYCQIYGTVKPEVDDGKKIIVVLFKVTAPDLKNPVNWSVFDHFVNDGHGKWFFSTAPGEYLVGAFKDVNGDLVYQLDEPVFAPVRGKMIQCRAGDVKTGNDLIIPEQGRSNAAAPVDISSLQVRSTKQQLDISLGQVTQVGAIAALDEPRFADAVAEQSLWKPLDFLIEGNAGIYFLEPYSAQKMPVLFVHGINGTPRNFDYLIRQLDRSRYQPWVVYYPSGAYIDNVARYIDQMLQQLQVRYQFDKVAVIAHSMGGLVSRSFILQHLETVNHLTIPLFVSISTPWNGHAAAKLGVDHAPTPVYSWEDLAPGSRFLHDLFYTGNGEEASRRKLPDTMSKHLLFSFIESQAGDGTVSLLSELRAEAQDEADRIHGFPQSHMGILNTQETANLLKRLLDSVR